jgi:signal peptidase I
MTQTDPVPDSPDEPESASPWGARIRTASWKFLHGFRELGIVVATALVLSILLRTFVFQLFFVPSESMLNTLKVGDKIVASKVTMSLHGVHRGDVVVFHDPGDWLYGPVQQSGWRGKVTTLLTDVGFLPSNSGEDLVKRVVGVAGDHIVCCTKQGLLQVNGHTLHESSYAIGPTNQVEFNITVPKDRIFVMGDNRANSRDSRFHLEVAHGTVPLSEVRGVVVLKLWPFSHFGSVSAPSALTNAKK